MVVTIKMLSLAETTEVGGVVGPGSVADGGDVGDMSPADGAVGCGGTAVAGAAGLPQATINTAKTVMSPSKYLLMPGFVIIVSNF